MLFSSISTALNRIANVQQADARDVLEIENPELKLKRG